MAVARRSVTGRTGLAGPMSAAGEPQPPAGSISSHATSLVGESLGVVDPLIRDANSFEPPLASRAQCECEAQQEGQGDESVRDYCLSCGRSVTSGLFLHMWRSRVNGGKS